MLDLKITGGRLIDGTGAPARRGDVGVTGDAITAVGDLAREPAGRTIDASGRTVAPGFIDMHSHSDWRLWDNRRAESKIRQGVTTEVVGNCGFSPAPVSDQFRAEMKGFALYLPAGMDFSWKSVREYLARYEGDGVALNVAQLIGHGTLRLAAMGFARRPPTAAEQAAMERMMDEAMADGAYGLATGLIYAPGSYAATEEIIGIARRAAGGRGFYASHIRGEGATLLDAVAEAIRVGREGGLPAQVSHVKAAGRPNWGRVADALALIDAARAQGQDVMGDVYPYTASSTTLRTLLPDWVRPIAYLLPPTWGVAVIVPSRGLVYAENADTQVPTASIVKYARAKAFTSPQVCGCTGTIWQSGPRIAVGFVAANGSFPVASQ